METDGKEQDKKVNEKEIETNELIEKVEEKPKNIPVKPSAPKFGPSFPRGNQFRGGRGNNFGGNARTGRGASRGR